MEYENKHEFSSNGKGNLGVTLGAIGTGLGLMAGGLNGVGLFGNGSKSAGCSEDHFVNRYEAAMASRIADLETEVKLRDANTFAMNELNSFRNYVDGKFGCIEAQLADQRVYNATNTAAISCLQGQVAELMSLTRRNVPNSSICPGWGDVTVSVTPASTTGA